MNFVLSELTIKVSFGIFELHDIYLALTRCKKLTIFCKAIDYNVHPQIEMKDIEAESICLSVSRRFECPEIRP